MSIQNVRLAQTRALLALILLLAALSVLAQSLREAAAARDALANLASQRRLSRLAARGLDINQANQRELERLPGIGPQLAQRIISCRREFGDFIRPRDLWRIPGFGDNRLSQLRVFIRTNPK